MMPWDVVRTMKPNWRDGSSLATHFSESCDEMSKRGEMTPVLFRRPLRLTTILPARWSSICVRERGGVGEWGRGARQGENRSRAAGRCKERGRDDG